jgi:hypothetical protein
VIIKKKPNTWLIELPLKVKGQFLYMKVVHNKQKRATTNNFVKRFTSWSRVDKKDTVIFFFEELDHEHSKNQFNVFCLCMKNRIGRQICCLNIVTPETLTFKQWKKKMVDNRDWSHWILVALLDNNLYSDSVLLRATVSCYLQL